MLEKQTDDELTMEEGLSYFQFLYGSSSVLATVMQPILDEDGELQDVVLIVANDSWLNTRRQEVHVGMHGSSYYADFDALLPMLRQAYRSGRATQLFASGDGDERVKPGLVLQTEWRKLPNGLIIETARDQTLIAAALEASGPVLILDLPEDGSQPSEVLAVNRQFISTFLPSHKGNLPTLDSTGSQAPIPLQDLALSVTAEFPENGWSSFLDESLAVYENRVDAADLPFTLAGVPWLRSFTIHALPDGRQVGIWVYRPAGTQALHEHAGFAEARLANLYTYISSMQRPIAAHRAVLNQDGELIDIEAVWANEMFQSYRNAPLLRGDFGSESRVRFAESLLPSLQKAWENGEATQYFRFEEGDDETMYRDGYVRESVGNSLEIETVFMRTEDDFILEWGDDIDMKRRLGSDIEAQRLAAMQIAVDTQRQLAARGEHDRLSRELHDNVLQELFVAGMQLSALVATCDEPSQRGELEAIQSVITRVSTDIRQLITGSKRQDGEPIHARMARLVEQWDEATPSIKIRFTDLSVTGATYNERIPAPIVDNACFVTKEAISNAVKHSGGDRVTVELMVLPGRVMVSVKDNGGGVDPRTIRASGTLNMRARAESLGGSCVLDSTEEGVTVDLSLPFELDGV